LISYFFSPVPNAVGPFQKVVGMGTFFTRFRSLPSSDFRQQLDGCEYLEFDTRHFGSSNAYAAQIAVNCFEAPF